MKAHLGKTAVLIAMLALPPTSALYPQSSSQPVIKIPDEIEFKGAPVSTAELYGDPTKAGLYVQRVKMPAGFKLPPHWHPEERTEVILSGTLYYAFGDRWDESKLLALPPGSFFNEPPRIPHFAWAKDGEVMLQITGIGPTGIMLVPQSR